MTTIESRVPAITESVRKAIAEQIAPIATLQADLERRWTPELDIERARARLRAGQVAYDPLEVIGSSGNLLVAYVRATVAIERAGLISDDEAIQARERRFQLLPLVAGWLSGEPTPRDRVKAAARRAAALVAGSILHRASTEVLEGRPVPASWTKPNCPCCGGSPDFAIPQGTARTLVCARCDTRWTTKELGCIGCGEREMPMLARIPSPTLGFQLVICNPCGRYMKEPTGIEPLDPAVDRVLTQQLDAAAEARGLRL